MGPTTSEINASTILTTNPIDSFIETDGAAQSTYWDLAVVSGSISAAEVPTPSGLWLIATGLLLMASRKR